MVPADFLKARVSSDTKQLVRAAADEQLLTESVWLRRAVLLALKSDELRPKLVGKATGSCERRRRGLGTKLMIGLPPEDRLLLRERAAARAMAPSTYVSVLVRAHLRNLAPLPKEELLALKRSVAELGAIGRNMNQIARAANKGERWVGPGREDLRAILKVCEGLRDHVKALIKENSITWEVGNAQEPG
jgi:Bacterial mobilisation protein (MobC)